MSKGGGSPTVSTYYVGIHFVLGHGPFDKISAIYVDEKLAWTGTATSNSTITINSPELFGGVIREGGIIGNVDLAFGLSSQTPNQYLIDNLTTVPAYRGVMSVILNHVYVGLNYYLKPWSFLCTRIHKLKNGAAQWQDSYSEIGTGLINAVHVIRECLTNDTWGLGHSTSLIDDTSFLASAQTCFTENLGFSFYWNKDSSINDFIQEVLKHIQASLYLSRIDGKFHLDLIRFIPDTSGLVHLTTANTKEVSDFKRKSLGDLVSQVIVKFTDNTNFKTNSVTVTDSALSQRQGHVITKSVDYSGVATQVVAQKLATRDLQQLSFPIYSCSIKCDRTAEVLNPGSAFVLTWPDYITSDLLMRVVSINLGTATNNAITIEAIQDNFQAQSVVYADPPTTGWVNPVNDPTIVALRGLVETPYYLVATTKGDTFAQGVATTNQFISIFGVSPTSDAISAAIWTTTGTTFVSNGILDFCFSALLATTMTRTTTSITFTSPIDLILLTTGKFIQIGNELLGVTAIGTNTLTVTRGVLDTFPEVHSIGDRIYGWNDFSGTDQITYLLTEVPKVKLLTSTPRGQLQLASAPQDTITIAGRMHKPYPPGNLQIGGSYWPSSVTSAGSVSATALLLNGNGTDGATTFTDSVVSPYTPHTATASGNARIRTAQSKFGGSSIYFDGVGDFLTIPTSTDFDLGTVYTIEFWMYPELVGANAGGFLHRGFYSSATTTWTGLSFSIRMLSATVIRCYFYGVSNVTEQFIDATFTYPINAWTHFAMVRNGTNGQVFVNGSSVGTISGLNTPAASTQTLRIGEWDYNVTTEYFKGFLEDIRIVKGAAVYGGTFTPPTAELGIVNIPALVATWASRNRFQQTAGLIDYYTSSITSEVGVTYSGTLKRTDTSAILQSFTNVSALTFGFTTSYIGQVLLELWSVNANGTSTIVSHTFNLT